jgi:hypothetical protein
MPERACFELCWRRCRGSIGTRRPADKEEAVAVPPKSDISGQWRAPSTQRADLAPEGTRLLRREPRGLLPHPRRRARPRVGASPVRVLQLLKDGDHRLLTDAEAAELLAVPKSWVGEAASAGRLPHVMLRR